MPLVGTEDEDKVSKHKEMNVADKSLFITVLMLTLCCTAKLFSGIAASQWVQMTMH